MYVPTPLTKLQDTILKDRVVLNNLSEFGYTVNDLYNNNFNPLKNIDKLTDIHNAGAMIADAIKNEEHIVLVTDYDADGLSSAYVLNYTFENIFKYKNYTLVVNERIAGNGFNKILNANLMNIHNHNNIGLIITADHGSSDNKSFKELKEYGIGKIIVTDHHTIPKNDYPISADIVINPQRTECKYYKHVSGCFIAYIAMLATYNKLYGNYDVSKFDNTLPYVAISTISDVMPLDYAINRQVVRAGLIQLNKLQDPVMMALRKVCGIRHMITYKDIGFRIAPLLNTANRMGVEQLAKQLITATTFDLAFTYARSLNKYNIERKRVKKTLLRKAEEYYEKGHGEDGLIIVVESSVYINGIIAGIMGEKYQKPTICFLDTGDSVLPGSGRGILPGFDFNKLLVDINNEDPTVIVGFGGHKAAVGCSIYKNKLTRFAELYDKYSKTAIEALPQHEEVKKVITLPSKNISPSLHFELNQLAPYGMNWDEVLFSSEFTISDIRIFGGIAKLKLTTSDHRHYNTMYFFNGNPDITVDNITHMLPIGSQVNIVYTVSIGTYNNRISVNINIVTIK